MREAFDRRSLFRQKIEPHYLTVVEKVIQMALDGNEAMLRLLLPYLLPARPKDEPVDVLCGLAEQSIKDQVEAVITAFSEGQISPLEAKNVLNVLEMKVGLVEVYDLEQRLKTIEEKVEKT